MKTNMTENDKRLLFILAIGVIIVAIGYWGILPQIKRYNKLEEKVEYEEEEKSINQLKLANVSMIEIQADEYEAKIAEKKDEFYQIMTSSEIDRMMTQLAVERDLEVYDLQFAMPGAPTSRMAYQNSALYEKQKLLMEEYAKSEDDDISSDDEDLLDEEEDDDEDEKASSKSASGTSSTGKKQEVMDEIMGGEEGAYQPNTDIYAVPVTMVVGGDIADLNEFIKDLIKLDKRILLTGYSWGEFREVVKRDAEGNIIDTSSGGSIDTDSGVSTEELSDTTLEVITKKSLTVKLEIYMCDTKDIASDTDASEAEE